MMRLRPFGAVFSCLLCLGAHAAFATTRHVDGQDTECAQPGDELYCTIQDGVNAARSGDTVYVYEGIYAEHVTISQGISLIGEGADQVRVLAVTADPILSIGQGVTEVTVSGLSLSSDANVYPMGIEIDGAQNVTVRETRIQARSQGAMSIGIKVVRSLEVSIDSNQVDGMDDVGIALLEGSSGTVSNNFVTNSNGTAISFENGSIGSAYHNTIVGAAGAGLGSGYTGSRVDAVNNIIVNTAYGVRCVDGGALTWSANNLFDNDTRNEGCLEGNRNISSDPRFVGPEDYHITRRSPCVGAGMPVNVRFDFDGERRPLSFGIDIGADEFSFSP